MTGAFIASDVHEFWTLDLSNFGKGEHSHPELRDLLKEARKFCRHESYRGAVLLLIGDKQNRVSKAIQFDVAETELDPSEFRLLA